MGNLTINNGGVVANSSNLPNIDLRYGPYNSIEDAYEKLNEITITPGLTVGIISQSGEIVEYTINNKYQLTPKIKLKTINNQNIIGDGNIDIEGESGTTDYTELTNKPTINGIELTGSIQLDIPTKTSDLLNDSDFVTTLDIPTKTSDLLNDSGFLSSEAEPAFNSSPAKDITNEDITNWNGKQNLLVSGTNIATINNQNLLEGGNIQIGSPAETITVSDTTYTISSLVGNKVYTFTNSLTSLTITAYGDTTLETLMYFTAGTDFTFNVPNDSKYIIEEPVFNTGVDYIVSIQNKIIVVGEIV